MYPLYWTPSKEGIFMRYSYEFKKKCVEMYRQGIWADTPDGIKQNNFRNKVRLWANWEEKHGAEILRHKKFNRVWSPDEKLELVSQVIAGNPTSAVSISAGINISLLLQWVRKYKQLGYNGLVDRKKGRPPKEPNMKKLNYNNPRKLKESEYEELIRLRAENAYIKAEIEVIKKAIALREEKQAALLKAKKQQSSKNSVNKDIN